MGTTDCSVSDNSAFPLSFISLPSFLPSIISHFFLWLQSRDSLGVTYVSSSLRPNIVFSLTHLYISSHALGEKWQYNTTSDPSLMLTYMEALVSYTQQKWIDHWCETTFKPLMQIHRAQQCSSYSSLVESDMSSQPHHSYTCGGSIYWDTFLLHRLLQKIR